MGAAIGPAAKAAVLAACLCVPRASASSNFVHFSALDTVFTNGRPGGGGLRLEEIASLEFLEASEAWQLQNLLGSIRLFLRSAQKGYEVGEYCFRWGQYHELPPADIKQAFRWYTRGARMNHRSCTTMLGKLHFAMGQRDRARESLRRTAEPSGGDAGDSLAQWFLAEMSLQGGAFRDAVRWWKRSAENGDVDAMMRLSQVFAEGAVGIPQEAMRAQHWLFAAAAHGHKDALARVDWDSPSRPEVESRWMQEMERHGWI
mmetsp:Transcript_29042/g.76793  ORF Transcript_29042/g.76793 Transcript_29042/m.76793 type:complete len:259 (-) Transcript_29042:96-872(-)